MELRHLRYFVAVADAGSLTVAAGRKLHTSQPSLSRQIRDLEEEVGAQLLTRGATRKGQLSPAAEKFCQCAKEAAAKKNRSLSAFKKSHREAARTEAYAALTDFAAARITSSTTLGWESIGTWLLSTS